MFTIINYLFNMTGGEENNETITKVIKKTLDDNKLIYDDKPSGISININNEYIVIIPNNFNTEHYIQIKKTLKDKDGNCIECVYLYKLKERPLKFVNRIKILDINNIKSDEDDSRIEIKLVSTIEKLLNEIIDNHNKKLVGGSNYNDSITNTDINDYKYLLEQSKYKNLKKILNATLTETSN